MHEKNTVDCHISSFPQGHGELEERLCRLEKIIHLPPLSVRDFELRIVVIIAVFVDAVS